MNTVPIVVIAAFYAFTILIACEVGGDSDKKYFYKLQVFFLHFTRIFWNWMDVKMVLPFNVVF